MAVNYERRGAGEPLVLLHGLGGEWHAWEPVLDAVSARHDVLAVDLPGFGGSPALPDDVEPTPAELARSVAGLLDDLELAAAHVAGNSLGGWVALELASLGRARTVTTLSAAGFWTQPLRPKGRFTARRLARAVLPLMPALLRSERGRRLVLTQTVAHPERVTPEAALQMVRAYASAPGFEAVNAAMRARVYGDGADLDVPVTLAWGEHDRLVARPRRPPPGARTVILRGCGHIPMWDDPEAVALLLLEGASDGLTSARVSA